jgi:FkbM family methyltransferase
MSTNSDKFIQNNSNVNRNNVLNMRNFIKNWVSKSVCWILDWLPSLILGRHVYEVAIAQIMIKQKEILHQRHSLIFSVPNRLNLYRVETFATKEPETLEWIESLPSNSVLWDVGANIGLYSVYAAVARRCNVWAFEPSVFNLELLARNIALNKLQESICIVPIALSDQIGSSMFKMSNTQWGGALSTFGQNFDQDGKELRQVFEYQTLGLSIDDACVLLKIPQPQYLKMDVDGIEHLILSGGKNTLRLVDSVLIEINDKFVQQAEQCAAVLKSAGLILYRKCDLGVPGQYNQWWIRSQQTLED